MKITTALIILGLLIGIPGAHAADWTKTDAGNAMGLALAAHTNLDDTQHDYSAARFRNVFAHYTMVGAVRVYFLCGSINAPNAQGGMTGWNAFLINGSSTHNVRLNYWDRSLENYNDNMMIIKYCNKQTPGVVDSPAIDYSLLLTQSETPDLFVQQYRMIYGRS